MRQIFFKEGVDQREFTQLAIPLYEVIEFMSENAYVQYGDFLVVTSIHRFDTSTHGGPKPYRFIDFAMLEHGGREGSENLRTLTNQRFKYDPLRPEMETIPPIDHGSGPHLHVQTLAKRRFF